MSIEVTCSLCKYLLRTTVTSCGLMNLGCRCNETQSGALDKRTPVGGGGGRRLPAVRLQL